MADYTVYWSRHPVTGRVELAIFGETDQDARQVWVKAHPSAIRIVHPPREMVDQLLLERWYTLESPHEPA